MFLWAYNAGTEGPARVRLGGNEYDLREAAGAFGDLGTLIPFLVGYLTALTWDEVVTGVVVLGLPQAALTLGNAIVATVEENNALFPDRRITVRTVAIDHGVMNLVGTSLGGVPMCHGAGGMAGHVRFGARTGGALVILGAIVLFTGLFLADSVATLFRLFPPALLGVILVFGGLELAAGAHGNHFDKADRYVVVLTAGVAMWNMGAGYLAGLILWHALQREVLRIDPTR